MGTPATGSVIAGRYRLAEMVGEGGMARVWRAFDETLARQVAVKFLFLREGRAQDTMVERFLREARIAAAVRHPNVVDILDFGTTDDDRPFMVMEILEGESLEDRMQRSPMLTLEELVQVVAATLDGLGAVHKAGIVHRDMKPDNVFLLDDDGEIRPKVLDFGVSRETDPTSGRRSALTTGDGYLVGTPEYMSPEQARGLSDIDRRSDLYSVGVILYETMTGQLPYDAEAVGDLIIDIVQGGAPRVADLRPEVGDALSAVVERAMAPRREDRFASAREMRDALLLAAEDSLGLTVRGSLPLVRPVRRVGGAAVGAKSDVHTMDEIEIPLALGEADETPRAWERDPPSRERAARWRGWAAALLVAAAGAGAWWAVTRSSHVHQGADAPDGSEQAIAPRVVESERTDTPGSEVDEPPSAADESPETVTVTLRGIPPEARVHVDGEWVRLEGEALTLPRDEQTHRVIVAAPGRRPWRLSHVADRSAEYRVRLHAGPPGARPDEAPPPEAAPDDAPAQTATAGPEGSVDDSVEAVPESEPQQHEPQTNEPAREGEAPSASDPDRATSEGTPASAPSEAPEDERGGVFRDLDY